MKTLFGTLTASFVTLISPVIPMVILAILMVIIDTCFGIWRTVKLSGWDNVLSKKLSEIFTKMLIYGGAIIVVYLIERFIAKDIVAHFIAIDLFMTKVVAGGVVYTELKSIDEKYKEVYNKSFLKGLRKFITRVKEEKDNLNI